MNPHPPLFDFASQFAAIETHDASDNVSRIEESLQVRLPVDFGRFWERFSACIAALEPTQFALERGRDEVVVALTLDARRDLELPHPYVVLEAGEDALLLLACAGAAQGEDSVHLVPRAGLGPFMKGGQPRSAQHWATIVDYVADVLEHDEEPSGTEP